MKQGTWARAFQMGSWDTVGSLIEGLAEQDAAPAALLAKGREALSRRGLRDQIRRTAGWLAGMGVSINDRVAIALPGGPELATCFLGVAAAATAAPLNHNYREAEFEFYLDDLSAKAVIVEGAADSAIRRVARQRGIPIVELQSRGAAGEFSLKSEAISAAAISAPVPAGPDDVAMVLHTSGTTSRPKQVPLTHRNILTQANHLGRSLALTAQDRCLNVMPLHHIHGLVGGLLSALAAGGSSICGSPFEIEGFFEALSQLQPTWYTAVPTIHHAVVMEAGRRGARSDSLRFIRSCSAALPPTVMEQLEGHFNVPVVEAYGMTEASHQIACNPLPPRRRKPGSVGVPTGVEVAILDDAGAPVLAGDLGEVAIRGENVTRGYIDNPEANAAAFTNGWFRTGDQGRFDKDGYLFLTGRLKEMINRGGENISPREIDECLLEHPDVAQALTFAIPHETLGESVGAAILPRAGCRPSAAEIRAFAAVRISEFKVPDVVVIVDQIPTGPTGKPQRIGLAQRLGLVPSKNAPSSRIAERPAAASPIFKAVQKVWGQLLSRSQVGADDNFFLLGGDSLRAMQLVNRIRDQLGVHLQVHALFESPTLAAFAAKVESAGRRSRSA